MSKGRMIESCTWEDDFFTALSLFDRLLWIGLITGAADDQGRMQDVTAIIRSKLFPTEDILLSQVESSLNRFSIAHKITRYIANEKKLIQINNWWKHQTPRWASPSNYPAPSGWMDRVRCHTTGNKMIEENWDSKGGYIDGYIASNTMNDVKDDVKGDDEQPSSPFSHLSAMIASKIQQAEFTGGPDKWTKAIKEIVDIAPDECDIDAAIVWMDKQSRSIVGPWSLVNPIMIAKGQRERGNNHKSKPGGIGAMI